MTRAEWIRKRDAIMGGLDEHGVDPSVSAVLAYDLAADLFGPEPTPPARWDHVTDVDDVAVGLSLDRSTVDVHVDGNCVFLSPPVAREMAAALVDLADHIDDGAVVA